MAELYKACDYRLLGGQLNRRERQTF